MMTEAFNPALGVQGSEMIMSVRSAWASDSVPVSRQNLNGCQMLAPQLWT